MIDKITVEKVNDVFNIVFWQFINMDQQKTDKNTIHILLQRINSIGCVNVGNWE